MKAIFIVGGNGRGSRSSEDTASFLQELLLEWVICRHLRVATRKLANQGVSTFKYRPEEGRPALSRAVNKGYAVNGRNRRVRSGILGLRLNPWS